MRSKEPPLDRDGAVARAHAFVATCAAAFLVGISGCATDPDDRAFFNSGWMRPEAGANARLGESGRVSPVRGAALTPNAPPPPPREPAF